MTRVISPVKLAGALALALVLASAVAASGAERSGTRAHESIIGGTPVQAAPTGSAAPAGSSAATVSSGSFASVAEIVDIRGVVVDQCTGTVVAPRLILTAGHCAENIRTGIRDAASGFRVLTGAVAAPGVEQQVLAVSAAIVYEGFRRRVDKGDAALLVLSTPTSAPAIRLATSADAPGLAAGSTATIAGWGNTAYGQQLPTEDLRSAGTVVQASSWCRRNAPPFFRRSELCTIDPPSYATGACNGDSGGPLLGSQGAGEEPVQIGIAIHVYGRCSTRRPSVFTRVDWIAPWVRSWIDAYRAGH